MSINEQKNHHYFCAIQNLKIYECPKCKYTTHLKVYFAKHKTFCLTRQQQYLCATQNLRKYYCTDCNFSTDFKVCLTKHDHNAETQVELKTYSCQKCGKFRSKSRFLVMKHEHEKCKSTKNRNEGSIIVYFKCKHCPFEATKRAMVKHHSESFHSAKEICCKCQYCGHQIKTATGMKYHIFSHHISKENSIWYECTPCGFRTRLKQSYRKHKHYHKYKNLYCTQCDYVTKQAYNLSRHMKGKHSSPEKIEWLKCDWCPFKTKWPSGLKRHANNNRCNINPYTSVDEFACDQCSLRTNNKHNLQQHVLAKHVNAKTFKCELCSYEATKYHLRRHLVTVHKIPYVKAVDTAKNCIGKNVEEFVCHECAFKTTTKRLLARHIVKMHVPEEKIKWFECEQCFFQTRAKANLNKHIRNLHWGDVQWQRCQFCDYKAKRKVSVTYHTARMHGSVPQA